MKQLNVIIATYNRAGMLERTLRSLFAADRPANLRVDITVVDNNSNDNTREVVERWQKDFGQSLAYLLERQQGKPYALNAGIKATSGELVGMIDDDEEVEKSWLTRIESAFDDDTIDFIGGPYHPRWGAEIPAWLPKDYLGVIGWVDGGDEVFHFDENYPGTLMGGNAVIKRKTFDQVGLYSTVLNRTGERLLAGEDEDMYRRLLAVKARGLYLPDLIIYHYVPPERLTKQYYRRWCFWRGVSCGLMDRERREPVAYLGGIPRYLYGRAMRGAAKRMRETFGSNAAQSFSGELAVWDLAGFFYGKHFYDTTTN